ncbi:S-adenosylmethionine:tRNA ribosyltransferase-isomerase [Patescibacteria group bacterium]|nr:S-adenosylmethionine:tRNA ribosyltransferase-isomerase [Patescibacteria group bacterium]
MFDLTSYDYILPEDRIAQEPHHPADEAKLLVCGQDFQDAKYIDLPMLLDKNSVLFFNDTKVMQSRVPVV